MSRVQDYVRWEDYENVVVFGTGDWGEKSIDLLCKLGVTPVAFCDNNKEKHGTCFHGFDVYSLEEINAKYENVLIVVAVHHCKEIIIQLLKTKNKWAYITNINKGTFISDKIPKSSKMLFTSLECCDADVLYSQGIELVITERCSLKCRDCANLMQYYEKPVNYTKENMFLYLDKINEVFDIVHDLKIIGGEPFVNKDIYDIIDYATTKENIVCVSIYTNATIPLDEKRLETLDKTKLSFFATNYEGLSRSIEKNVEILEKFRIPYMYIEMGKWYNCTNMEYVDRTECELEEEYNRCVAKNHLGILHGKIFLCPFASHTYNLKGIPDEYVEYVDIVDYEDINKVKEDMKKFIYDRKYAEACKYCTGRNTSRQGTLDPGVQTKEVLPYKKY